MRKIVTDENSKGGRWGSRERRGDREKGGWQQVGQGSGSITTNVGQAGWRQLKFKLLITGQHSGNGFAK